MTYKSVSFILPFLIILVSGCNRTFVADGIRSMDSLNVIDTQFEVEGKSQLTGEFYSRFGIVIPKFYTIRDSLSIDLNDDNLTDTLVVFSPVLLEDQQFADFRSIIYPKRLLVEIINKGTRSEIGNTYENLISNTGGVLSKYTGMNLTDNGFSVTHQSGSRYSWIVISEFRAADQGIELISYKKICSLEGVEQVAEYKYHGMSANSFDINDSIQNNCNCDSMWKALEKQVVNEN
jgi:hypothetical protein